MRIRKNDAVGTEEYIIGCHTGKPAEAGNPATWTDFESACVYAKENGCAALAYALDGKDGICCIELPLCKDKDGTYTELAQNIFRAAPKTYCENTGDKQGLRVLGTTQGMDLRSFSKDGDLKFYRNAKFLVLTCEGAGYQRLCSFDTPQMKEILESKCAKRSAWQGAGKGVEGLTVMSDRETAEKAIASKHGETFKALYDGQNLYGEPFRNDMSFMRRLAFWCNGDQEKMLRIFATSKLYCPEKVPDYYENMAITATEKINRAYPQRLRKNQNRRRIFMMETKETKNGCKTYSRKRNGFYCRFKNSVGVKIRGLFNPESRKSLSPVSRISAFADKAARRMGRSIGSRI